MAIQRATRAIATHLSWGMTLILGVSLGLGSCAPGGSTSTATTPTDVDPQTTSPEPQVPESTALRGDEFTVDEITGAGCSMALIQSERAPEDAAYIFFNPMQPGKYDADEDQRHHANLRANPGQSRRSAECERHGGLLVGDRLHKLFCACHNIFVLFKQG